MIKLDGFNLVGGIGLESHPTRSLGILMFEEDYGTWEISKSWMTNYSGFKECLLKNSHIDSDNYFYLKLIFLELPSIADH